MEWRWQNIVERGSLLLLAVLAASIPIAPRAHAQSANAQLSGLITDLSNAAVPGAQIQAVNAATNVPYAAVSNGAGNYVLPEMLPGSYNITVSASGFGAEKREGLDPADRRPSHPEFCAEAWCRGDDSNRNQLFGDHLVR